MELQVREFAAGIMALASFSMLGSMEQDKLIESESAVLRDNRPELQQYEQLETEEEPSLVPLIIGGTLAAAVVAVITNEIHERDKNMINRPK